jgi:hypothetical protein
LGNATAIVFDLCAVKKKVGAFVVSINRVVGKGFFCEPRRPPGTKRGSGGERVFFGVCRKRKIFFYATAFRCR